MKKGEKKAKNKTIVDHGDVMNSLSGEKSREEDILLHNELTMGYMKQFIWEMDLSTGDAVLFETDYTKKRCAEHGLPTDRTKVFSYIAERLDEESKKIIKSIILIIFPLNKSFTIKIRMIQIYSCIKSIAHKKSLIMGC